MYRLQLGISKDGANDLLSYVKGISKSSIPNSSLHYPEVHLTSRGSDRNGCNQRCAIM